MQPPQLVNDSQYAVRLYPVIRTFFISSFVRSIHSIVLSAASLDKVPMRNFVNFDASVCVKDQKSYSR